MGELIQMMKSVLLVRANCAKFTVKCSYLCSLLLSVHICAVVVKTFSICTLYILRSHKIHIFQKNKQINLFECVNAGLE